jgi:hypothetical protein
MFYFPCSPVHKICLLFTEFNNEDRHIFRDSELRKQSANFKQTQRKQIIYFHVNRYIIFRDSTYYQNKQNINPTCACNIYLINSIILLYLFIFRFKDVKQLIYFTNALKSGKGPGNTFYLIPKWQ